jgi:Fe-S cluster assembly ATP-binding protein
MHALAIENLSLSHGGKSILKNLSLAIPRGKIHVLMGRNGSGKSSLLHALVGQTAIDGGKITLDGETLVGLPPEMIARKGLFLAFQMPIALPGVSISQLLRAALQAPMEKGKLFDHMQFHDNLEAAMARLGMDPSWANRSVNDGFSGGERKRCEMLQLIMLRPKYALLDEIDSGVDVDAMRVIGEGIRSLREGGTGVLVVTHQCKWLELLNPSSVHLLSEGRISRSGGMELAQAIEADGFRTVQ